MSRALALDSVPEPRHTILEILKRSGSLPIAELSGRLGITYEAVRQHLRALQLSGWVTREVERTTSGPGRPRSLYRLTAAGDHLFPKDYDDLAVALLDAAADRLGPEAVRTILEEVARRKVERWEPQLRGLSLRERLEALEDVYLDGDPFTEVQEGAGEEPRLVELNCPYLEVARRRPALCSVTVSVLRRLLGREVVRTERFQDGDGRCVFQVGTGRNVGRGEPLFDWEPPHGSTGDAEGPDRDR